MKHASLYFLLLLASNALANNVRITNVSTIPSATFTQVAFDISWDNSWRVSTGPNNYDAVWVFIKYKVGNVWTHLDMTGANNSIGGGFTINVPSDSKGCFIYRSADGSGNVALTNVRVGVPVVSGSFDIKVFGIEMVFVPQGNLVIGDGNGTTESNTSLHLGAGNSAVLISTSLVNDIRADATAYVDTQVSITGIGIDGDGGLDTDDNGTIDNAFFPTGFQPFFCMKYEITERAFTDFLNTLTYTQQASRLSAGTPASPISTYVAGLGIEIVTPGIDPTTPAVFGTDFDNDNIFDEATDGDWKATSGHTWMSLCAYLDWAALRPMTQLEYEKACRGPNAPVLREYAWGNANIFSSTYSISAVGQNSESVTNASTSAGNAVNASNFSGSARNGIFATPTSGRTEAGASYYGVLELTGNVSEVVVTVLNAAGRSFVAGFQGDGSLTANGDANQNYWPGINGNSSSGTANMIFGGSIGVTGAAGSGSMGNIGFAIVDSVSAGYNAGSGSTSPSFGGRGVR